MAQKPLRNRLIRTWGRVAALLGVGMMPCPDCGTPMIFHIWPLAGLLILSKIIRKKTAGTKGESKSSPKLVDQNPL